MKHYFFIAILIVVVNCNSSQHEEKATGNKDKEIATYPLQVENAGIKELYDSAKWYLYTWNCDELYKPKSNSSLSKPFGELELRFDNLVIRNDTLILVFNFIDKEQSILPSMMKDYKQLVTGVGYDTRTKKKIFMLSSNVTITNKGNPQSRYENPLQPEVKAYIKKNRDKLNSWFREEAKRRKIID